jgi:hypothetical protein
VNVHLCIELQTLKGGVMLRVMVFNATFNNITFISWRSVLLVEETGVPGEKVCSLLFLTSMPVAKQYVSTGSRGQDSPPSFFKTPKTKLHRILQLLFSV